MTAPLPSLHTAAAVAEALGQSEHYVKERCRLREWPHRRLARGQVGFTTEDFNRVLELCAVDAAEQPAARFAFAPRSRRAS